MFISSQTAYTKWLTAQQFSLIWFPIQRETIWSFCSYQLCTFTLKKMTVHFLWMQLLSFIAPTFYVWSWFGASKCVTWLNVYSSGWKTRAQLIKELSKVTACRFVWRHNRVSCCSTESEVTQLSFLTFSAHSGLLSGFWYTLRCRLHCVGGKSRGGVRPSSAGLFIYFSPSICLFYVEFPTAGRKHILTRWSLCFLSPGSVRPPQVHAIYACYQAQTCLLTTLPWYIRWLTQQEMV